MRNENARFAKKFAKCFLGQKFEKKMFRNKIYTFGGPGRPEIVFFVFYRIGLHLVVLVPPVVHEAKKWYPVSKKSNQNSKIAKAISQEQRVIG